MERPSMMINVTHPGSDLAGETAAAMAATSILFKDANEPYSNQLIKHAKELFEFARTYKKRYHESIPDIASAYRSWSGYDDELVWAAIWLYRATKEGAYLQDAVKMYNEFRLEGKIGVFSWDEKTVGVHALMAQSLPDQPKYAASLRSFCDKAVKGQQRSPLGQLFYLQWGSLRYAANAAFICLQAAELIPELDSEYTDLAVGQINYMLGINGRSFVVGYGPNPPVNAHHASATCPDAPAPCDWSTFSGSQPNAHVLYGALVGGPAAPNDFYQDKRNDYIMNEVTCDYNAGFQGVLAALHMKLCL